MKTIISILSILLIFNQQEPLSKIATIKAPQNIDKVSTAQIVAYEKANFKYLSSTRNLKHVYKVGGVIIGFEDYNRPAGYDISLEDYKERILGEVEQIERRKTKESVDIVSFNNTKFLIRKVVRDEEYCYYFVSETKKNSGIKGGIRFKKADLSKAHKLLDELLKSIKF